MLYCLASIVDSVKQRGKVEIGMLLTDLCSQLTRPQKKLLAAFLGRYSVKLTLDAQGGHHYGTISVDIPTDVAGLRRRIYEGTRSIYKNLPHPPLKLLTTTLAFPLLLVLKTYWRMAMTLRLSTLKISPRPRHLLPTKRMMLHVALTRECSQLPSR